MWFSFEQTLEMNWIDSYIFPFVCHWALVLIHRLQLRATHPPFKQNKALKIGIGTIYTHNIHMCLICTKTHFVPVPKDNDIVCLYGFEYIYLSMFRMQFLWPSTEQFTGKVSNKEEHKYANSTISEPYGMKTTIWATERYRATNKRHNKGDI